MSSRSRRRRRRWWWWLWGSCWRLDRVVVWRPHLPFRLSQTVLRIFMERRPLAERNSAVYENREVDDDRQGRGRAARGQTNVSCSASIWDSAFSHYFLIYFLFDSIWVVNIFSRQWLQIIGSAPRKRLAHPHRCRRRRSPPCPAGGTKELLALN